MREIHFEDGTRFSFEKVSREKLYGKQSLVVVDENGSECSPRHLSRDGSILVAPGGVSQSYVNSEGDAAQKTSRVDLEGLGLPVGEPTLNRPQKLWKVNSSRFLDHTVSSVYALTLLEGDPGVKDEEIFETVFAYRKGSLPKPAFLIHNEKGYFLLVGEPHRFDFCEPDQQIHDVDSSEDPFSDDFDFGMMG